MHTTMFILMKVKLKKVLAEYLLNLTSELLKFRV